jgi:nucleotide sugar dehydrogenase
MDIIVVCVPSPLDRNLAPDLQYVIAVTRRIAEHLRRATHFPRVHHLSWNDGRSHAADFGSNGSDCRTGFLFMHSPERVDPGNRRYTTKNTNKVIGGVGPNSLELGLQFYAQTIENMISVSSARAAEMVKVFENTYRAVNIALVNELALLCDRMNLNVWEVLDAAFTKPFGIQPFYPGPGVGGHCIPLDPHYLEWKAREYNFTTRFIGLAGEINRKMPEYVRDKAIRVLNQDGKSASKSQILLLGVTYKKDLNDCRESPALEVGELLLATGAKLFIHDPLVASVVLNGKQCDSVPLTEDLLAEMDLVVITTDHSTIDYEWLVRHARRVLDTRNATKHAADPEKKVVLL